MKLETILRAAVSSMIRGHHKPHCFSSWIQGKGYIGDATDPDYLIQLERAATSEIENYGWASDYAESGYSKPRRGIVWANWNCLPRGLDRILERAGYTVEWSDEWATCTDCNRAVRTEPDSYYWEPGYAIVDGDYLCKECAAPTLECDHCKEPWTKKDGGLKLCQTCYDEENKPEVDECAGCDKPWEIHYQGDNWCFDCYHEISDDKEVKA